MTATVAVITANTSIVLVFAVTTSGTVFIIGTIIVEPVITVSWPPIIPAPITVPSANLATATLAASYVTTLVALITPVTIFPQMALVLVELMVISQASIIDCIMTVFRTVLATLVLVG